MPTKNAYEGISKQLCEIEGKYLRWSNLFYRQRQSIYSGLRIHLEIGASRSQNRFSTQEEQKRVPVVLVKELQDELKANVIDRSNCQF